MKIGYSQWLMKDYQKDLTMNNNIAEEKVFFSPGQLVKLK